VLKGAVAQVEHGARRAMLVRMPPIEDDQIAEGELMLDTDLCHQLGIEHPILSVKGDLDYAPLWANPVARSRTSNPRLRSCWRS
jgi:hypothetical protein